ncbi:autotransporter outer membrane beta-barrel domain-containing protein [Phyllobacterium leguminum]|uniref:Outer membrane autotransporter protein n=1 Tax=Phyllobacterium leguminum TaxID=314237 RepID=A0A318TDL0_9HYPH|nr:autotransporter outer membrane beta-barrel domain-containing protein [Phyllobacterium leguminum]PYE86408.1 outer membrane autotransporter protein [Phyllobacterium leguminum]
MTAKATFGNTVIHRIGAPATLATLAITVSLMALQPHTAFAQVISNPQQLYTQFGGGLGGHSATSGNDGGNGGGGLATGGGTGGNAGGVAGGTGSSGTGGAGAPPGGGAGGTVGTGSGGHGGDATGAGGGGGGGLGDSTTTKTDPDTGGGNGGNATAGGGGGGGAGVNATGDLIAVTGRAETNGGRGGNGAGGGGGGVGIYYAGNGTVTSSYAYGGAGGQGLAGNGGNGGVAMMIDGSNIIYRPTVDIRTPTSQLIGGNGGAGSAGQLNGTGGYGLWVRGDNNFINNTSRGAVNVPSASYIQGGNAATATDIAGAGVGLRIDGDGNSIIQAGAMWGGMAGANYGHAAEINGNNNIFEIRQSYPGYQFFDTRGHVIAVGTGNVMELGTEATNTYIDSNYRFDLSTIVDKLDPSVMTQYSGFSVYKKTGPMDWNVKNAVGSAAPWIIVDGALVFDATADLSAAASVKVGVSGAPNLAHPTLDMTNGPATSKIKSLAGDERGNGKPLGTVDIGTKNLEITAATGLDYAGQIKGSGTVTISGGRQIFSGDNSTTLTGNVILSCGTPGNCGTLSVGDDKNLGSAQSALDFEGGTLQVTGTQFKQTARAINWGPSGGSFDIEDKDNTFTLSASQALTGRGPLTKLGAGTLVLTGPNTYSGATTVTGGTLVAGAANVFSPNSAFSIGADNNLDLNGFNQTMGSLANAGTVLLGKTGAGTTLTVNGDYTGQGGVIHFNTVLGDDTSPTDLLHVKGATSGTGVVMVTNVGGKGAQTKEGIKLIEVDGDSNGKFTLAGGKAYQTGKQTTVAAGAYAYQLYQGGVSTPTDGDWYLRSQYQAGIPVYEAYAQVLQELNDTGTMRHRLSNRIWSGEANPRLNEGDGPGTPASPDEAGAEINTAANIWGRIESAHGRFKPNYSTSDTHYNINTYKAEAGLDGKLYENEMGSVVGGVTMHYGYAKANMGSVLGSGDVEASGYGLGGTLTWYGDNGVYVDAVAKTTWYSNDLNSDTMRRRLIDGNEGFGYALSLEAGKRVALDGLIDTGWASDITLTPQAQLTWSSVKFDGFTDPFGAQVTHNETDSLKGRLGIAADYGQAWRDSRGHLTQTNLYASANLSYEFRKASKIEVTEIDFATQNDRTWGGIGGGGTYSWADGKYALYGEVSVDTSLEHFADSYKLTGNVGLKVKW